MAEETRSAPGWAHNVKSVAHALPPRVGVHARAAHAHAPGPDGTSLPAGVVTVS